MTTEDNSDQVSDSTRAEAPTEGQSGGLLDRLPIPRRFVLPLCIGAGALLGLILAVSMPRDWLVIPETTASADHAEHADGGQKAYYA